MDFNLCCRKQKFREADMKAITENENQEYKQQMFLRDQRAKIEMGLLQNPPNPPDK